MSTRILHGSKMKLPMDEDNLGQLFFESSEKYTNQICHIDGTTDQIETYGSIKLRSTRVAIALQNRGITSKHVIAFCSANTLDNTIPMLATFYLGAKVTNLEPSLSVRHTKHLVTLTTPKIIFVEEAAVKLIEKSLAGTAFGTEIVVFGKSEKYCVFDDFVKPQESEEDFRPLSADPSHTALILFSSGTTGLPKAICHSHRSFYWAMLQTHQSGMRGTMFHFTSFYWMSAMLIMICCFKFGGKRVFARNPTTEEVFKIFEKYEVSYVFMAPVLTYRLTSFENASNYDTSKLQTILLSGTPIASSQIQKLDQLFPNAVTMLGYGMSEIGLEIYFNIDSDLDLAKKKLGACGLPGLGVQVKVVDPETEKLLGCNQKGELRFKTPSMMLGYYRADSSGVFDDQGFLKSGDVGYYDEDECFYVIERIKEMFKYQSWHIVPSSIEQVLLEHPKIEEAVVFGFPCGEDGEVPAACVVLKKGEILSEEDVDGFLKKNVADRERLRGGVTFVEALPRTPTGKVIRKEVRDYVVNLRNG